MCSSYNFKRWPQTFKLDTQNKMSDECLVNNRRSMVKVMVLETNDLLLTVVWCDHTIHNNIFLYLYAFHPATFWLQKSLNTLIKRWIPAKIQQPQTHKLSQHRCICKAVHYKPTTNNQLLFQMVYPLVHDLPFIFLSASGLDHQHSAQVGNLLNPAYIPSLFSDFPRPMSFCHRLENLAWHFIRPIGRQFFVLPRMQEIVSSVFSYHTP